jgi:hypothetical protein
MSTTQEAPSRAPDAPSRMPEAPSHELLDQIARIELRLGLVPEPRDSAEDRLGRVELLLKVADELGV